VVARANWKKRVSAWRRSGLTSRDFAEREGLNAGTLAWWAWKLKKSEHESVDFVDVTHAVLEDEVRIELVVGQVVVRVFGEVDGERLRRILDVLEARG
jgi:hypothetical protein